MRCSRDSRGRRGPRNQSQPGPLSNLRHWEGAPEGLTEFLDLLEEEFGREAEKNFIPMQPGDVRETWASVDRLKETVEYEASTPLEEGLEEVVCWYRSYHELI